MWLQRVAKFYRLTHASLPCRERALSVFLAFSPTCTEKLAAHANYTSPYSVRFLENVCVNFFNQFVFLCVSGFFYV